MDKNNCTKCKKEYDSNQLFACDSCKKLLCSGDNCGNLTGSEVKCLQLKTKRKLIFLCEECEAGFWKVPSLVVEMNELKQNFNELIKEMKVFKSQHNTRNDKIICDDAEKSEEIISEMLEREKRQCNIMIANVMEPQAESIHQQKEDDIATVKTLLENFNIDTTDIKVFRIGRVLSNKSRLVKVILHHEYAKKVLRNKNKVHTVKIFSDQTKKQRDYYINVKNKLQEMMAQGDNSKTIKFINNKPVIVPKNRPVSYMQKNK